MNSDGPTPPLTRRQVKLSSPLVRSKIAGLLCGPWSVGLMVMPRMWKSQACPWTSTAASARVITLPPFLIRMLRRRLERHANEFVFTTEGGTSLWRSTFIRRVLNPPSTATKTSHAHEFGLSRLDRD